MRAYTLTSSALILGLAVVSEAWKILSKIDPQIPFNSHLKDEPSSTTMRTTTASRVDLPEFVPTTDCPLCELERHPIKQLLSEEELNEFRIEVIKKQILSKLNLNEKPHITTHHKLPEPLRLDGVANDSPSNHISRDTASHFGRTSEIISIGKTIPKCHTYTSSTCAKFDILSSIKFAFEDVESAMLWVYKLPDKGDVYNQTIVVSELSEHNRHTKKYLSRRRVKHKRTQVKKGWVSIDIKNTVRRWIEKPKKNFGLKISCKTCKRPVDEEPISSENDLKPFVAIKMKKNTKRRTKRRATDCDSGYSKCCRASLYVSFSKIKYDFITQPAGYNANYCKGTCAHAIDRSVYSYSSVMNRAKHFQDQSVRSALTQCCVPTVMSSLSMIYQLDNGTLAKKSDVPNMSVEECGCA